MREQFEEACADCKWIDHTRTCSVRDGQQGNEMEKEENEEDEEDKEHEDEKDEDGDDDGDVMESGQLEDREREEEEGVENAVVLRNSLSFLIRTSFLISARFCLSLQNIFCQEPNEFLLRDQLVILESYACAKFLKETRSVCS